MNHKGFTLVELMIVIAIIGILTAVGIPSFMGFREQAKNNVLTMNFKSILNILTLEAAACESGIPLRRKRWPDGIEEFYTECRHGFGPSVLVRHYIFMPFKNPYFNSSRSGLDKLWEEGILKVGGGSEAGFIYFNDAGWKLGMEGRIRSMSLTMFLPDGEVMRSFIEMDYYAIAE